MLLLWEIWKSLWSPWYDRHKSFFYFFHTSLPREYISRCLIKFQRIKETSAHKSPCTKKRPQKNNQYEDIPSELQLHFQLFESPSKKLCRYSQKDQESPTPQNRNSRERGDRSLSDSSSSNPTTPRARIRHNCSEASTISTIDSPVTQVSSPRSSCSPQEHDKQSWEAEYTEQESPVSIQSIPRTSQTILPSYAFDTSEKERKEDTSSTVFPCYSDLDELTIQVQRASLHDTQSLLNQYFEDPKQRYLTVLRHAPLHQQVLLFALCQEAKVVPCEVSRNRRVPSFQRFGLNSGLLQTPRTPTPEKHCDWFLEVSRVQVRALVSGSMQFSTGFEWRSRESGFESIFLVTRQMVLTHASAFSFVHAPCPFRPHIKNFVRTTI